MSLKPDLEAHWYAADGKPMYEYKAKDGTYKKTTLREARKLNLVPGASAIPSVIERPWLSIWKIEQGIRAAIRAGIDTEDQLTPELLGEIYEDSKGQSKDAMETGSAYHAAIERLVQWYGNPMVHLCFDDFEPMPHETVRAFLDWYDRHGCKAHELEVSFASPKGWGGRIDMVGLFEGTPAIFDWKTQNTAKNGPKFYNDWPVQLAGYGEGYGIPDHLRISTIISRDEPGVIKHKVWDDNDKWTTCWHLCFAVWCSPLVKNYYPGWANNADAKRTMV